MDTQPTPRPCSLVHMVPLNGATSIQVQVGRVLTVRDIKALLRRTQDIISAWFWAKHGGSPLSRGREQLLHVLGLKAGRDLAPPREAICILPTSLVYQGFYSGKSNDHFGVNPSNKPLQIPSCRSLLILAPLEQNRIKRLYLLFGFLFLFSSPLLTGAIQLRNKRLPNKNPSLLPPASLRSRTNNV